MKGYSPYEKRKVEIVKGTYKKTKKGRTYYIGVDSKGRKVLPVFIKDKK